MHQVFTRFDLRVRNFVSYECGRASLRNNLGVFWNLWREIRGDIPINVLIVQDVLNAH